MQRMTTTVASPFLFILVAALVALLFREAKSAAAASDTTYPLTIPELPKSCECKEPFLGWSTKKRVCQQGSRTTCQECIYKPGCSTINTIIGRGLRAYEGDCVYRAKVATCYHEPTNAALSYPSDIAIDHFGNIVIADSGNNRVRLLVKEFDRMFIIAGSGEVGFSGDGGPGRKAMLRYPERLTVFMSEHFENDEILFTDFRNQRVRKLTYDEEQKEWIIQTIVGSGSIGDGCPAAITNATSTSTNGETSERRLGASGSSSGSSEEPCDPLTAGLLEPRGLAMDRKDNLYIADSGNRKIRRVAWSYTDPKKDRWFGKEFQTFMASGNFMQGTELYAYNGLLLSGFFKQKLEDVSFNSIYSLEVDEYGNLIVLDSGSNLLWGTPTSDAPDFQVAGVTGRYFSHFIKHFLDHKKKDVTEAVKNKVYAGLKVWLEKEGLSSLVPELELYFAKEVGKAYWKYGHTEKGYWCQTRRADKDSCDPVIASYALWTAMYGACLDISSNIYIPDFDTSVVTKITAENKRRVEVAPDPVMTTLKGCRCRKHWVAGYLESYNRSNASEMRSLECEECEMCTADGCYTEPCCYVPWDANRCAENVEEFPEFLDNPPTDKGGNVVHCYTSPTYLLSDAAHRYQPLGYCGSPDQDPVTWCYVEDETCQQEVWGYCAKPGDMKIQYDSLQNASIFNHPMRQTLFYPLSLEDLDNVLPKLSNQSVMITDAFEIWTLDAGDNALFRFTHITHVWTCHDRPPFVLSQMEGQTGKLSIRCWSEVTPDAPATPNAMLYQTDGGKTFQWTCPKMKVVPLTDAEKTTGKLNKDCLVEVRNKTDLLPGSDIRAAATSPEGLIRMLYTSPFMLHLGANWWTEEYYRVEDCLDWCASLDGCKAVMMRWNNTQNKWAPSVCALYDEMYPYNVYEFNRWEVNYDNASNLPNETGYSTWLEAARKKFGPPKTANSAINSIDHLQPQPLWQDPNSITDEDFIDQVAEYIKEFGGHLDGLYLPMPVDGYMPVFKAKLSEWGVPYFGDLREQFTDAPMTGTYGEVVKRNCEKQEMKEKPDLCIEQPHCGLNDAGICEYKEEYYDYVLDYPLPSHALRLEACMDLCIQTPDCYSIGFPGCFLMNRTNFPYTSEEEAAEGDLISRVYVRVEADIKVDRVLGKFNSATFKGNSAPAKDSLINRATQCKVDKATGDVLIADTWNHKIRKITGLNANCQFLTDTFSVLDLQQYLAALTQVETSCIKNAEMRGKFTEAQQAAVEERSYKPFYNSFCAFTRNGQKQGIPPSPKDWQGSPFAGVSNLGVLCSLCSTYDGKDENNDGKSDRPAAPLCPSSAHCACRESMKNAVYTDVFTNCPASNAYYDKWHRTLTALIGCWVGGDWVKDDFSADAVYLVENSADRTVALEWLGYWIEVVEAGGILEYNRRLQPDITSDQMNYLESALKNASSSENANASWPWSKSAADVVNGWLNLGLGASDLLHMKKQHHRRLSEL